MAIARVLLLVLDRLLGTVALKMDIVVAILATVGLDVSLPQGPVEYQTAAFRPSYLF